MAAPTNPVEVLSDIHFNIPVDVTFTEFLLHRAQQFGDRLALVSRAFYTNFLKLKSGYGFYFFSLQTKRNAALDDRPIVWDVGPVYENTVCQMPKLKIGFR